MNFDHKILKMAHEYMQFLSEKIDIMTEDGVLTLGKNETLELTHLASEFIRYASILKYVAEDKDDCCCFNIKQIDESVEEYTGILGATQYKRLFELEQVMENAYSNSQVGQ